MSEHYDIIVLGSGPAGQKAAIQGAKAGKRVALIERERGIGGSCVYRGTIPSKTLRESALHLDRLRRAVGLLDRHDPVAGHHAGSGRRGRSGSGSARRPWPGWRPWSWRRCFSVW